jgi:hypothetical protein
MPEQQQLDTWGIVEVMGHKRFAGHITEQAFGSASLIRVDVPATEQPGGVTTTEYSKLVGISSVYCITPTTEDVARRAAAQIERYNDPIPVALPESRRLANIGASEDAEIVDDMVEDDDFIEAFHG